MKKGYCLTRGWLTTLIADWLNALEGLCWVCEVRGWRLVR